MNKKKFVIIDGNAILHRAFHALPPLKNREGKLVNAAYGFASIFLKTLKDLKPDYIAVAFDLPGKTFRHIEFPEYKAQRAKPPQDLYDQIPLIKEMLDAFNVAIFEKDGYEADDIIGTLARKSAETENIIITGDLDALQLVDENTKVCALKRGISETVMYDEKAVVDRYGLTVSQMIDYKALRGDPSDNIPGVPGIGEKTATELLKSYETIEKLYEAVKGAGAKEPAGMSRRVFEKLRKSEEIAILSKRLVTIVRDVPIDFKLSDTELKSANKAKAAELFQRLGFKSLLARLKESDNTALPAAQTQDQLFAQTVANSDSKEQNYILVDTEQKFQDFLIKIQKQDFFVFDCESTSLNPLEADLLGISFCWKKGEAYFASNQVLQNFLALLKDIFANPKIRKIGQNLKYDIRVLKHSGIDVRGVFFDTMVASYILNPGERQHNLDKIVFEEFDYEMMPIEALIGEKRNEQIPMQNVPAEKLSWYSCEDADFTFRLYEKFSQELKDKKLQRLFEEIDRPLVSILAQMEDFGMKIDAEYLSEMSKEAHIQMDRLEKEIINLAGIEFNVNSTKQLKEILFERLKISAKGVARGKTGLSTAADVLEKLKDAHPIIPKISEYRELAKLISTYLDALPELINKTTGRVHTSFNQTVTATGRLSSSNPNLQNIPIRGNYGKKIRRAFIAESGNLLISADYSQIELRIAAALSNDKTMLEAFKNGEDIHTRTAAEIWEVAPDKVTSDMRRNAKAINFGIMYGMGANGLAAGAGISREEAQIFIEKYFSVHKGVYKYLGSIKQMAYEKGFVETLFGRRRYFPELQTEHQGMKAAAEREAVNHPIQGTAADLMKLAMIRLYEIPQILQGRWKMILQVHDELIFEAPEKEAEEAAKIIKKIMEQVYDLGVPIIVETSIGKSWEK
ncbi:MAG TPA: DNA polymerase I [Patescibacteria group bacterium]|nr:DNA polymerase I [Patescibacteria group bacterium]